LRLPSSVAGCIAYSQRHASALRKMLELRGSSPNYHVELWADANQAPRVVVRCEPRDGALVVAPVGSLCVVSGTWDHPLLVVRGFHGFPIPLPVERWIAPPWEVKDEPIEDLVEELWALLQTVRTLAGSSTAHASAEATRSGLLYSIMVTKSEIKRLANRLR